MKKKKNIIGLAVIIIIIGIISIYFMSADSKAQNGKKIIVYKSPECGCCVNYIGLLENKNYDVEVITTDNMAEIKNKYNVPQDMESCHTTIVDNYVVEGHIPFAAIDKLLAEKPDIEGIALPDMPAGSPGMPGIKNEPFKIYQLNGEDIFLTI